MLAGCCTRCTGYAALRCHAKHESTQITRLRGAHREWPSLLSEIEAREGDLTSESAGHRLLDIAAVKLKNDRVDTGKIADCLLCDGVDTCPRVITWQTALLSNE